MPTDPIHPPIPVAEPEFQAYGSVEIVSTYGQPQAEYAAIRKSAGLMDLPQRGILELTGKDRLDFLNRLITNQTFNKQSKTGLSAGQGVYSFFLTDKGRIVADMNVLERGDRTYLELDARMVDPLRIALEKFLFSEKVSLTSQVGQLHELAIHGPKSRQVLAEVLDSPLADLPQLGSVGGKIFGVDAVVWRDDPTGSAGYFVIVPEASAAEIRTKLLERFGEAQELGKRLLRPIGWAAFNATRIEAGRILFGIDFDDSVLPAETGLVTRAVSFTKGCYLGQEIVTRMHTRGQAARGIVGIRMNDDALPIAGSHILDEQDNQVGGITSSTMSPILSNSAICLGLVKKQLMAAGTELIVPAEGAKHRGKVVELPFWRETTG